MCVYVGMRVCPCAGLYVCTHGWTEDSLGCDSQEAPHTSLQTGRLLSLELMNQSGLTDSWPVSPLSLPLLLQPPVVRLQVRVTISSLSSGFRNHTQHFTGRTVSQILVYLALHTVSVP